MSKTVRSQRGFTVIELALIVVVLALIGLAGYYAANKASVGNSNNPSPTPVVHSEVYQWGAYLGGTAHTLKLPTPIAGNANITAISASNSSNYALQCVGGASACATDGVVLAWGDNNGGQLGNGTSSGFSDTAVKVKIPVKAGVGIVAIGEARNEGIAIDSTGQAWGWGQNGHGSLCIGTGKQLTPVKITGVNNAVAVQGGQDHVLFLLANHTVIGCGKNTSGQLGTGTVAAGALVKAVGLSNIVQISAGNVSSAALDSSGNVYMWGSNNHGQAGNGTVGGIVKVPTKVNLPAPAVEVYTGGDLAKNGQTFALLNNGDVYSWGDNTYGQLGTGNTITTGTPTKAILPAGVTASYVATGGDHSLLLDSLGNVWGWGNGGSVGAGLKTTLTAVKVDSGVDMISTTANDSLDHHKQ